MFRNLFFQEKFVSAGLTNLRLHYFNMNQVIINIDGGSRGNPGPSAIGAVFSDGKGGGRDFSEYIGKTTNNEAEYRALIFALKKAKAIFGKEKIKKIDFEVRSDSELLVRQMKGEYKIKEPELQGLFLVAWNLKIDFGKINFVLVPREENKRADRLVNEALNKESRSQSLL